MNILNLYACLGGNRYKWNDVKKDINVTAVELDEELAKLYQERFPNDTVIVADAHKYLLDHYKKFDFIWSSPPCPTHSKIRMTQKNTSGFIPKYPDMKLYEEILFLQNYFDGKYIVENVIPFYEPLIPAQKRGRHIYWCNFILPNVLSDRKFKMCRESDEVNALCAFHDFDFYKYKGEQRKDKIAKNLVDYQAGETIFKTVLGIHESNNTKQFKIF